MLSLMLVVLSLMLMSPGQDQPLLPLWTRLTSGFANVFHLVIVPSLIAVIVVVVVVVDSPPKSFHPI